MRLRYQVLFEVFFLSCSLGSCWTIRRRRSTLLSWKTASDPSAVLGWSLEVKSRDEAGRETFHVEVGSKDEDTVSISLPVVPLEDDLAASIWPPALAGAILCRLPGMRAVLTDADVLELGCGLGLTGLAAATVSSHCQLTDNNAQAVDLLQTLLKRQPGIDASVVEWRDDHSDVSTVDIVLGTAVAYYYYLLRPLMDTVQAYSKPDRSILFVVGQANRVSQWDLYNNLVDGCYNQLTDEHEAPWLGPTKMLLYQLEMEDWVEDGATETRVDGVVPIAALLHESPGFEMPPLTEFDYQATEADQEAIEKSW